MTKTTIQLDTKTWAMLDRLKMRNESFDDVVQKLIQVAPQHVSTIAKSQSVGPRPRLVDARRPTEADRDRFDLGCTQHHPITGEPCGEDISIVETYDLVYNDEKIEWAFCENHENAVEAEGFDNPV